VAAWTSVIENYDCIWSCIYLCVCVCVLQYKQKMKERKTNARNQIKSAAKEAKDKKRLKYEKAKAKQKQTQARTSDEEESSRLLDRWTGYFVAVLTLVAVVVVASASGHLVGWRRQVRKCHNHWADDAHRPSFFIASLRSSRLFVFFMAVVHVPATKSQLSWANNYSNNNNDDRGAGGSQDRVTTDGCLSVAQVLTSQF